MKESLPIILFLGISVATLANAAERQSHEIQQSTEKEIPLKDALSKVSDAFGIKFTYERAVVEKVRVKFNWNKIKKNTADNVLDTLLTPAGLNYRQVEDNYYIIIPKKAGDRTNNVTHITILNSPGRMAPLTPHAGQDTIIKPHSAGTELGSLSGRVLEEGTGKPIELATVTLVQPGLSVATDAQGYFRFPQVPTGNTRILVQYVSRVPFSQNINIVARQSNSINVILQANALNLKIVEVVATENRAGGSTSSNISRKAIEHLQATSLGDVMQLLPGSVTVNPDFSDVNRFAIRQIFVAGDVTGNLGTSVYMNGSPVSNNANFQSFNTSSGGTGASFSTSAGGGLDLRSFSADNIESVEVIRGIPSVEYGDLTSGAVIVKTKAGKSPLNIKARINPKLTQFWIGKGFALGEKAGNLNVDIDYTKAVNDQRYIFKGYDRVTGNILYTKQFFKERPLLSSTGFSYGMNLDNEKQDPDDKRYQKRTKAENYTYRFITSGKWNLQKKFARTLNYVISADYAHQKGFQQELLSGWIYPLSTATQDVTVEGEFVPSEYLAQLNIDGKPLNVFAKVTNSFFAKTGTIRHKVLMGTEWRTDVNFGEGRTYDLKRPPRMQGGNGFRPRPFKDIPAMNQFSLYAEDNLYTSVRGKNISLNAGVRFDNVQPKGLWNTKMGTSLSPRLNLSVELVRNFSLHLGYGITSKAPTLLYLYPDNAYYDLVNINHYADDPAERLVMLTTRVFNTENKNLKIMKNEKKELGFDWTLGGGRRLTVTAFYEKSKNGYSLRSSLNSIRMVPLQIYDVVSRPVGEPPVIEEARVDTFIADYNMPTNDNLRINKGIEFDLDLGRFDNLRTSFVFNGAYIHSRNTNTGYDFYKYQYAGSDPSRLAIFAPEGRKDERISTTLRAIHNIPELRLVVTFSVQTIWSEKSAYMGTDSIAIGYIRKDNSQVVWLNKNEREQITRETQRELFMPRDVRRYAEDSYKPLWLFNVRLTKEIGKNIGFSFFANNVFMDRHLEAGTRYPFDYSSRNPALFFGTEVNIRL